MSSSQFLFHFWVGRYNKTLYYWCVNVPLGSASGNIECSRKQNSLFACLTLGPVIKWLISWSVNWWSIQLFLPTCSYSARFLYVGFFQYSLYLYYLYLPFPRKCIFLSLHLLGPPIALKNFFLETKVSILFHVVRQQECLWTACKEVHHLLFGWQCAENHIHRLLDSLTNL